MIGYGGRIWTYDLQVMSLTSYLAAPPRDWKFRTPSGVRGKLVADICHCKENVAYFRRSMLVKILHSQRFFHVEFLVACVSYWVCPFFWQLRNLFPRFSSYYHWSSALWYLYRCCSQGSGSLSLSVISSVALLSPTAVYLVGLVQIRENSFMPYLKLA